MFITIPRTFRIPLVPATVTLSDEDFHELTEPFPAKLTLTADYGQIDFESPRAAVDFVGSLRGRIPFVPGNMSPEEEALFNDPDLRPDVIKKIEAEEPHFDSVDRVARRWGISSFSIAAGTALIAITALVLSLIALAN